MSGKSEKSVVGDLINFRGLVYAPMNENGVIFLFGKVADDLNMYVEEIKPGFPDCIGRRFNGKGWEKVSIEFEYKSSNFRQHKHNVEHCDMIICWEHDWSDCPIEVLELKTEYLNFENTPVSKPESRDTVADSNSLDDFFKNANSSKSVIEWYDRIYKQLSDHNQNIWAKIGKKYIGIYTSGRAFASVFARSQSIKFDCYSGNKAIENTSITNKNFAPNWSRFSVKKDEDVDKAVKILIESHGRIKKALAAGNNTGYFSGGVPFGTVRDILNGEDEEN